MFCQSLVASNVLVSWLKLLGPFADRVVVRQGGASGEAEEEHLPCRSCAAYFL